MHILTYQLILNEVSYPLGSGSMEPGFRRGDLIVLTNPSPPTYTTGDIVVYKLPSQDVPIVHRIIESFNIVQPVADHDHPSMTLTTTTLPTTKELLLTKGDNNPIDDVGLYGGLEHIEPKHVIGKVRG